MTKFMTVCSFLIFVASYSFCAEQESQREAEQGEIFCPQVFGGMFASGLGPPIIGDGTGEILFQVPTYSDPETLKEGRVPDLVLTNRMNVGGKSWKLHQPSSLDIFVQKGGLTCFARDCPLVVDFNLNLTLMNLLSADRENTTTLLHQAGSGFFELAAVYFSRAKISDVQSLFRKIEADLGNRFNAVYANASQKILSQILNSKGIKIESLTFDLSEDQVSVFNLFSTRTPSPNVWNEIAAYLELETGFLLGVENPLSKDKSPTLIKFQKELKNAEKGVVYAISMPPLYLHAVTKEYGSHGDILRVTREQIIPELFDILLMKDGISVSASGTKWLIQDLLDQDSKNLFSNVVSFLFRMLTTMRRNFEITKSLHQQKDGVNTQEDDGDSSLLQMSGITDDENELISFNRKLYTENGSTLKMLQTVLDSFKSYTGQSFPFQSFRANLEAARRKRASPFPGGRLEIDNRLLAIDKLENKLAQIHAIIEHVSSSVETQTQDKNDYDFSIPIQIVVEGLSEILEDNPDLVNLVKLNAINPEISR